MGLADLWRYLVLWEYGGVYIDIDNMPGKHFLNATVIEDDMDAFLEVERGRFPSQYFMSASPHHPITFFAVQLTIDRLFCVDNIVEQNVPVVTGPGALKTGVLLAIGNGYPQMGTHVGMENRTLTMVNTSRPKHRKQYIFRGVVVSRSNTDVMNMTHYRDISKTSKRPKKPCLEVLYDDYLQKTQR